MIGINIDNRINRIENELTNFAKFPVVGTLAGAAKVIMGGSQFLTGLVCSIISVIPSAISGDWSFTDYSWTHLKHGLGNIMAGTLEAIPLIGTGMFFIREYNAIKTSDAGVRIYTGHERKWMPYDSLVERDLSIDGHCDDWVDKATQAQEILTNAMGNKEISVKERIQIAQEAIDKQFKK